MAQLRFPCRSPRAVQGRPRQLPRLACAVVALAIGLGGAAQAAAESLADVVAYAYDTNPGIQAQRAALKALDESYVQARSGYGLTASLSGGLTSYEVRRNGARADAETDRLGLTVTQPLYTGGRVASRVRSAKAQILAGREQLRRAELDLLQRVVAAYVSVLRDEQLLRLARDNVKVLEQSFADTQEKARVRTVTLTDVAQSQARLAQARTQAISLEEQLATSRAQFMSVVGRYPGSLEPPPELQALPESIDQAITAAEANNPQLRNAVFTEQASRARLAAAKAAGLPSVSARFEMERAPLQPYQPGPYDDSRSASVVFTQPLFAAGQIRSGIRQAAQENTRDRLLIDDTRLQVLQAIAVGWERLNSLRRQIETLETELRANELAFFGVRQEEQFALRSNIEVLNASAELSASQLNLTRARAAEYVARVQLLAATGVLGPETLAPGAEPYDPSENFRRVRNSGATPLEWPVRALDSLAAPPVGAPKPASIPPVQPSGSPAEAAPGPQPALRSTADVLELELDDGELIQTR